MAFRRRGVEGAGVLVWLAAQGCADPCIDDGLLQDPGDDEDCPALASQSDSESESETETVTVTITDSDGDGDCNNGVQDGDETDVDCGGTCEADCGNGQGCGSAQDCASGVCTDEGECATPTCDDGVQNGGETDVDCGGDCPGACEPGEGCLVGEDCTTMNCEDDTCQPPSGDCADGMQNGDETDVDCGGSCPMQCDDGEGCIVDIDCVSGNCDPDTMTCGPACDDGVQNGDETDVDCGGSCPMDCDDGEGCLVGEDCVSMVCDPDDMTCTPPSCDDGIQNGDETDVDCGGSCGNTCETGEVCNTGADCIDDVCDPDDMTCAPPLTVEVAPACADFAGEAIQLTAVAMGGTGTYTYSWDPPDGLDDPTSATPLATPTEFTTYTVTVDDGVNQASDVGTVVNASPFNLENACTLYQGVFLGNTGLASITYSLGGTVACEEGNNDFGLHLCEDVVFQDVQLQGVLEVTNDQNDDDIVGLVWGAQNASTFYSLSWKRTAQNFFGCSVPEGIVVKRVEALDFATMTGADVYCPSDTLASTLLLDPSQTTTNGWEEGQQYLVTIDYLTTGSSITVTRISDMAVIAMFDVVDATFPNGFFGSTTISQENACVGPLNASCL